MQHAVDIFRFVLAFKGLIINDLQPLPHTMSTARCGQHCHEDNTCISFFHDVNTMHCYSYCGILSQTNTNLTKLSGIMYYFYSKDGLCSNCVQKRIDVKKTISGDDGIGAENVRANTCREKGYKYWHKGDICYKRMQGKKTRNAAFHDCLDIGGNLFSINTEQKHVFFVSVVAKELNRAKCYISGIRTNCVISCSGPWAWNWVQYINESDSRWHPGSPVSGLVRNCMVYSWKNGKYLWEETACFEYEHYFCEIALY